MSLIKAIKQQLGLSVTPANNFTFDAGADNGTMKLARNSGQDIMTVDAAGKVAFPQNAVPAFSAYRSTSQPVSQSVSQTIVFDTKEFDTNTAYNTANGVFTPGVAGYYQVNACITWAAGVSGNRFISLFKNTTRYKDGTNEASAAEHSQQLSALVYLGVSDYILIAGYQTGQTTLNVLGASSATYFQAVLVRSA